MNLKEAYSILELPSSATPDEAKKKYRELTKKFHPDINKEPGAEDKFKKINEAYQVVSSGKSTDRQDLDWDMQDIPFDPFGGFNSFFMNKNVAHKATNVDLNTRISFKDSVLGCKKELKFSRNIKCKDCNGNGKTSGPNGCTACNGKGQTFTRQGNTVFVTTCQKCHGKVKTEPCNTCQATGLLKTESAISVSIQGGIQNGDVLRINGMGNFVTAAGPFDKYTDAHLRVIVDQENGLKLDGQHVVSELEISLLDALKGCNKSVNTILGLQDIEIKPQSHNKDEVLIPKLGVNGIGNQRVILKVKYPNDINSLIDHLSL